MADDKEKQENGYDAFISYSRKDIAFAAKLEYALEAYRPPKGLTVTQRHLKIFRDEGDLTGTEYYEAIERHLSQCNKFIVVCSPEARKSKYVNDEIQRWIKLKGRTNIIPILFEGLPNNEATEKQEGRKAFPNALYEGPDHSGQIPLATSYVGINLKNEKVQKGRFEGSWYTLLANIYNKSRAEIEERDRKRQVRSRNIYLSIAGVVIVALAELSGYALIQKILQMRMPEMQRNKN